MGSGVKVSEGGHPVPVGVVVRVTAAGQWQFEGFGNVVVLVGEVLAGERAAHLLRCHITDASRPSRATPQGRESITPWGAAVVIWSAVMRDA